MSELKPCPFCGKENTVAGSTERMILGWWYACEDCFENRKGGVYEDRWNTRPIEDALNKRIAELEAEVTKCHELQDSYCDRVAELESLVEQLIWVGNDLLVSNTNPVTITLFNGLVCNAKERER